MCDTQQSRQSATNDREISQLISNIGQYKTQPLTESSLSGLLNRYYGSAMGNLGGQQTRSLGTAAGGAGGYAASRGLNPYAYIQHAQSGVYDKFTNQFGNLATSQLGAMSQVPQQAFSSQLASNQAMMNYLTNLYGLKQGAAQGLNNTSAGDYAMAGGKILASILFPPAAPVLAGSMINDTAQRA